MIALLLILLQDGVVFAGEEEAVRSVFAGGERVARREILLDPETHAAVRRRLGRSVERRYRLYIGHRGGRPTGYAILTDEVTKTMPMTFLVGVSPEGSVTEVVVLQHREMVGVEVARRRFLSQFRGKTGRDPLQRNRDMVAVVGATLSCDAAMRGVRKVLAVIDAYCLRRPEFVREAIRSEGLVVRQRVVMGSLCTIRAYGKPADVDRALNEIRRWDRILSNYDARSELSRLNREGEIEASGDFIAFLRTCRAFFERSHGAFDVTIAPLMEAWGFYSRRYRVPSEGALREALGRVGSGRIRIEGRRVVLSKGTRLDPGGIGKGYAVDRAAELLLRAGVVSALIDFGSTLYAIGAPPGEEGWPVRVRDPFRKERSIGTIRIRDEAVSTSGNYEKYFEREGKRYGHILDPRTGRPVDGVASVTVVAPTATLADALSTTLFVQGPGPVFHLAMPIQFVAADPRSPWVETPLWRRLFQRTPADASPSGG